MQVDLYWAYLHYSYSFQEDKFVYTFGTNGKSWRRSTKFFRNLI